MTDDPAILLLQSPRCRHKSKLPDKGVDAIKLASTSSSLAVQDPPPTDFD